MLALFNRNLILAIAVVTVALYSCHLHAEQPDAPAPSAKVEIGVIEAGKYGHGGQPLILIPGLAGGAWSWAGMIPRLSAAHEVYALTLPGFSGRAAAPAPLIDTVVADIAKLIRDNRLDRPVLVGHSLGAFIAYRVAIEHPSLVGGVVALDGYPVFSPMADADAPDRRVVADRLAKELARGKTAQEFYAAIGTFLAARMNDPERASAMTGLAALSDPESVAQYIMEMLPADLRPELGKIQVPILALVAVDSYKKGMTDTEMRAFYSRVFANAPQASIVLVHGARHFIEEDQPEVIGAAIESFLAGLPGKQPG